VKAFSARSSWNACHDTPDRRENKDTQWSCSPYLDYLQGESARGAHREQYGSTRELQVEEGEEGC